MANNSLSKFNSFDNHRVILQQSRSKGYPEPQIYVICMASCKAGIFYGKWINATQDVELINREIKSMLSNSPTQDAFEWAIFASGGFDSIILNRDDEIEHIHAKANFIASNDNFRHKLLEYFNNDFEQAQAALKSCYQGKFVNELEFVVHLLDRDSRFVIPDFVKLYIDYEMFKADVFANDYYSIDTDEGVHVFSVV